MTYPINYPTPQNCNVQFFYGSQRRATGGGVNILTTWVKPRGVSFVWFTLIGGGGPGGNTDAVTNCGGGGSGAVTNCLMPAFLVPDQLRVSLANSGVVSIIYQGPNAAAGYTLIFANGGSDGNPGAGGNGGAASARSAFASAGLYQSIAGQTAVFVGTTPPSSTTFLNSGASYSNTAQSNYDYPSVVLAASAAAQGGFSQVSPIIFGSGGASNSTTGRGTPGGVGSGGGGAASFATNPSGGNGGQSMAVIISW